MEYKPALGEPYRPVLSAPKRLSSLLPEWSKSGCVIPAALFNGVDPPRALKPAEILTPRVTQALPLATTTAIPAPASGVRTPEPRKTPNPSRPANKETSSLSDSEVKGSGSDIPQPSSSDLKHVNTQITNPKVSDPKDSDSGTDRSESNENILYPQDTSPSVPVPEKGPAGAPEPQPTSPGSVDTEQSASQDPGLGRLESQALNGLERPGEVQDSVPKSSALGDPKTNDSDADRFEPNVLDNPSSTVEPSKNKPNDHSNAKEEHGEDSNPQEEEAEVLESDTGKVKSINDETANKSPVTYSKANGGDNSNVKPADGESDSFSISPTNAFKLDEAPSPIPQPGRDDYSKPNDLDPDPLPQVAENPEYPPSGHDRNEDAIKVEKLFSLSYLVKAPPTAGPDIIMDSQSRTVSVDDSLLLPYFGQVLPTAASEIAVDLQSKSVPADDSAHLHQSFTPAHPTAEADAVKHQSDDKTADTNNSTSILDAIATSQKSEVATSSASVAASAVQAGTGQLSNSDPQGKDMHSTALSKAKSLGSSSLALRVPGRLIYAFCTCVLPLGLLLA